MRNTAVAVPASEPLRMGTAGLELVRAFEASMKVCRRQSTNLVARVDFTGGTFTGYGYIRARRVR